MKHTLFSFLVIYSFIATGQSLTVSEVLRQVELNNLELQTVSEMQQAQMASLRAENTLGETSVEYSPFFTSGKTGIASSELIVKQEVDFPTRFVARKRMAEKESATNEAERMQLRRDILLQAKQTCIDLIALQRQRALFQQRLAVVDSLKWLTDLRLSKGDATQLDVNRVLLERMEVASSLTTLQAQHESAIATLQALNGGVYIAEVLADESIMQMTALPSSEVTTEVRLADAQLQTMRQQEKMQLQGWLPKLNVGYRRNTEGNEKLNGFLIGGALPLFSQNKLQQAARHKRTAAELELKQTKQQVEIELQATANELKHLQQALSAYDEQLMQQTLVLLFRSVQLGQLPVTGYLTEADIIYRKLQERLAVETRYQKVLADLQKNSL